jgi:hypothetical protein
MRRLILVILLTMVALSAIAATKDTGTTVLKDVQPAGTTDKKHKHQQYDLSFAPQHLAKTTPAGPPRRHR